MSAGASVMYKLVSFTALACIVGASACAGTVRSRDVYRNETQKLLETRTDRLKSCYSEALKTDAQAAGSVTVHFVVEKKTGAVTNAKVDPDKSTAPEALVHCLLDAIAGLRLDPPDANEGQATFTYDFHPEPPSA